MKTVVALQNRSCGKAQSNPISKKSIAGILEVRLCCSLLRELVFGLSPRLPYISDV